MTDFPELREKAAAFAIRLEEAKATSTPPPFGWYPPMLPGHIEVIDQLLVGEHRRLLENPSRHRVADIGAADGDLGFFLESVGFDVDLYDGADRPKLLKDALDSEAHVHFVNLDHDFVLPQKYELVFLLHVLYHLRNPLLALDTLAKFSQYCIFSTRVANYVTPRRLGRPRPSIKSVPVGYLLDPYELNPNDAANFWIFSEAGLWRLLSRCGWEVISHIVVGDTRATTSDPHQPKAWCLLRSRLFSWTE